jgi:PTH1 family peptidyl-tRNA hydrolase
MKLIVGLGNPGIIYRNTRHNIGFKVIDALLKEANIKPLKTYSHSLSASLKISNEKAILAKPLTYMNLAGGCVKGLMELKRVELKDLLIILDDADLELGRIKLMARGGDAGHKGLRSIIRELGTGEFNRLRIGIGRPPSRMLSEYVLDEFKKGELPFVKYAIELSCNAVDTWVRYGIDAVMNNFNSLKFVAV